MATVVHNAPAERASEGSSGAGWVVAIIALLAIVLLFLFAGSFFNNGAANPGGTDINIPDSVDLNVNGGAGAGTGGAEGVQ